MSSPLLHSLVSSDRSEIFCGHNKLFFDKERGKDWDGGELRHMGKGHGWREVLYSWLARMALCPNYLTPGHDSVLVSCPALATSEPHSQRSIDRPKPGK